MGFTQAISTGFSKYATFSGRAARSEFWYWTLFLFLAGVAAELIDTALFGLSAGHGLGPVTGIFHLATLLPSLAVGARRLHDRDHSGWWLLLALTGIGFIVLLVWYCLKGTDGPNRFGADPLGYP